MRNPFRRRPVPQTTEVELTTDEHMPILTEVGRLRARLVLENGEHVTLDPVIRIHSLDRRLEMRFVLPGSDEQAELPPGSAIELGMIS